MDTLYHMDELPSQISHRATNQTSSQELLDETEKCKIQLYDINGRVKSAADSESRIFNHEVSESEIQTPRSSRRSDKITRYLYRMAITSPRIGESKKSVKKKKTKNEEELQSKSLNMISHSNAVIKRRRTVHVPLTDYSDVLEFDLSISDTLSSSQTSHRSIFTERSNQTEKKNPHMISITVSEPYFRSKMLSESASDMSQVEIERSKDHPRTTAESGFDTLSILQEDITDKTTNRKHTQTAWGEFGPNGRSPGGQRNLKYGKSYNNLLQQNVRQRSRDKAETGTYRHQRLMRRVWSLGDVNDKYDFPVFRPLYKFRRAVRTVIVMVRAASSQSQAAPLADRQSISWTQVHDEAGTSRRAYERFGLTFDLSLYKANREAQLSTEAKAILSMDPDGRTEEQLNLAWANLKQVVDAFGEFPLKMQKSLVRAGWYEHFERKRVIIRQGHLAENFYFILSGTAVVTVLETNRQTGEQYGYTVALLKKGNSFGELALMHGSRRSATVTCKNDMELLAVGRQDFIDIFMHVETNREPNHVQFLRSIDTLQGWPFDVLPVNDPKICIYTYFRRGVLLRKESASTDWIYVVVAGSCRVLKSLYATRPSPSLTRDRNSMNSALSKNTSISLPVSARGTPKLSSSRRMLRSGLARKSGKRKEKKRQHMSLPIITTRSQEDLEYTEREHIRHLDDIFGDRGNLIDLFNEMPGRKHNYGDTAEEKIFVQIQKLGPKEIYGLEQAVFSMMGESTNTSLVSDGAECVLINRKFFLQHLTEDTAKRIRKLIQPIPSVESLQQKLQNKANWEAYKSHTVSDYLVHKKHLHDFLNF